MKPALRKEQGEPASKPSFQKTSGNKYNKIKKTARTTQRFKKGNQVALCRDSRGWKANASSFPGQKRGKALTLGSEGPQGGRSDFRWRTTQQGRGCYVPIETRGRDWGENTTKRQPRWRDGAKPRPAPELAWHPIKTTPLAAAKRRSGQNGERVVACNRTHRARWAEWTRGGKHTARDLSTT